MIGIHDATLSLVVTTLAIGAVFAMEGRTLSIRSELEHADELRRAIVIDPLTTEAISQCVQKAPRLLECKSTGLHSEIEALFFTHEQP